MKTVLSLLLTLTTLFFISCGGDDDEKCTASSCKGWEVCADSGKCEKDTTKCEKDADCTTDKNKCDTTTFTCFEPCTLDEKRCMSNNVEVCKATGKWEVSETCTAPKVCKEGDFICEEPITCIGLSFDTLVDFNSQYAVYLGDPNDQNYQLLISFFPTENDVIAAGTYDLSSDIDNNYQTCQHCVIVNKIGAEDKIEKRFFQSEGTLKIEHTLDASLGESMGEVIDAKLVEVTIDKETFISTPVVDGECIEIQTGTQWKWDTTCETGATRCSDDGKTIEVCADKMWGQQTSCEDLHGVCTTKDDDAKTPECFVCADYDTDGIGNTAADAKATTSPQAESDGYVCKDVKDWYKVTLEANETIIFNVAFDDTKGNIRAKLYKGLPTTNSDSIESSQTVETGLSLSYTATEAGDYFLEIDGSRLKTGNSYKLTIKNACTTNKECLEGKLCNPEHKCETLPDCTDDTVCDALTSIETGVTYTCDLPTNYKTTCSEVKIHTCGGESINDKFSTAELIEVGVEKATEICVDDTDWYKFVLTEATTDLQLDLTFPKGDLDFYLLGPDNGMDSLGFGNKEQTDLNVGGVEKIEVKMLPAGTYYLKVIRYRATINEDTGEEEPTDVTSTYKVKVTKTGATQCTTATCADLFPLRSVCTDAKACANIDAANYSVATGGFCENKIDCDPAGDKLYNCIDFGKGTNKGDNFCTVGCSKDTDCTATGVTDLGWCATVDMLFGYFPIKACLMTCTNMPADYCKNVTGKDNATCNAGKCVAPEEK